MNAKIWNEAKASADWLVDHTLPEQHSRLYGVPEWEHAEDLSMPGISNVGWYGPSVFL
jgi:hypothetical protein